MSRRGRPADGGGSKVAAALRDPQVTQLLHVCGEHIGLVVDVLLRQRCGYNEIYDLLHRELSEQAWSNNDLWRRPLGRALQSRYSDCQCSPFGSLVMRNRVISGSMAEGLCNPGPPPNCQSTSDMDIMIELGPVHWTFPGTEVPRPVKDTPVGPTTATTAGPSGPGSDPTPRLVIAETENPGFVLLLQERRDDCPHQEPRPFKAETVTQFFRDYQTLTRGGGVAQQSTNGPACSFAQPTSQTFGVCDFDEVPCLHVPVWWFSDEFFTRHRRYNWPPEALRDDIRQFGLHLVPVGAPGSSTEKLQWRLSFSRAEVVVSSHLTNEKKSAVVAFKLCKAALGEEGKVIKSYFVKTAMLWLCEKTPTEDWKSVIQGVLKLLDFLDEAVRTGNLPCYFWNQINLLRFTSRADRKVMKKALGNIRQHLMRLLAHDACVLRSDLQEMLTHNTRRLSERQLRVRLTRWVIYNGVCNSIRSLTLTTKCHRELLPVLARSYTPGEVIRLVLNHRYMVQRELYQALSVAPADVASQVHLSSSSGGGFDRDAAPLLGLLTEDDLKVILGDPDAVRDWLRRHHQLPETQRPAGTLPADLRSPRDLCDLLLNIPLLSWVISKSVPGVWDEYQWTLPDGIHTVPPLDQARQNTLEYSSQWRALTDYLRVRLGMDQQTAMWMAFRVGVELRQLCDDPETLAEHRRMRHSLSDPWQLRHVFGDSH